MLHIKSYVEWHYTVYLYACMCVCVCVCGQIRRAAMDRIVSGLDRRERGIRMMLCGTGAKLLMMTFSFWLLRLPLDNKVEKNIYRKSQMCKKGLVSFFGLGPSHSMLLVGFLRDSERTGGKIRFRFLFFTCVFHYAY